MHLHGEAWSRDRTRCTQARPRRYVATVSSLTYRSWRSLNQFVANPDGKKNTRDVTTGKVNKWITVVAVVKVSVLLSTFLQEFSVSNVKYSTISASRGFTVAEQKKKKTWSETLKGHSNKSKNHSNTNFYSQSQINQSNTKLGSSLDRAKRRHHSTHECLIEAMKQWDHRMIKSSSSTFPVYFCGFYVCTLSTNASIFDVLGFGAWITWLGEYYARTRFWSFPETEGLCIKWNKTIKQKFTEKIARTHKI